MHLRGPMNVSQLAVYQLPDEVHTMQKRTTVPFYNPRRALEQRETPMISDTTAIPTQSSSPSWFNRLNKWTYSTTTGCTPATVTSTVTVKAACSSISIPQAAPNTTYIGPPLSCMTTSAAASIADPAPSASTLSLPQVQFDAEDAGSAIDAAADVVIHDSGGPI